MLFIKYSGLVSLKKSIEDAQERGAIGKVITSTYQNFTDIQSLNYFINLSERYSNFLTNIDYNCFSDNWFHSTGYLFKNKDNLELLIVSSNITRYALVKNIEWDLYIKKDQNEEASALIKNEFNYIWNKTLKLTNVIILNYSHQLDYAIEKWDMDYVTTYTEIKPNLMQRKALKGLRRYRDMGVKKAFPLTTSASGEPIFSERTRI